jgi:predicted nucleotidyltransferase
LLTHAIRDYTSAVETDVTRHISIGNVIRQGIVFDFKNLRGGTVNTDTLLQTVASLFALLDERQIDYLLVGGVAMLNYVEGRNTQDIDLIVAVSSLAKLPEIEITEQDRDFASGLFRELQVDFHLTSNPLFDKVRIEYATTQQFVEQAIPCARVEGLLLLKMYALPSLYRQANFARVGIYENDIATLMQVYEPALEPLCVELSKHLSDIDLAAVRDIVGEIQQRIVRFRERSKTNK